MGTAGLEHKGLGDQAKGGDWDKWRDISLVIQGLVDSPRKLDFTVSDCVGQWSECNYLMLGKLWYSVDLSESSN